MIPGTFIYKTKCQYDFNQSEPNNEDKNGSTHKFTNLQTENNDSQLVGYFEHQTVKDNALT